MVIGVTVMVSFHPNDGGNRKKGKLENLEKIWKNLEKLTSGNQNPTFKSEKIRIFSGNLRENSGKNDLKILYQPCFSF